MTEEERGFEDDNIQVNYAWGQESDCGIALPFTSRQIQGLILYVGNLLSLVEDHDEVDLLAPSTYDVELYFAKLRELCRGNNSMSNVIRNIKK